jgi:peroxiredoxin
MLKRFYLSILGTLLIAGLAYAQVTTGEPAKNFTLNDTNGKEHSLSEHKGQFVVLEWVNHDCPFVQKHYNSGNMQNLQKEFTGKGVVWFSINSSAPGKQGNYSPEEANNLTKEKGAAPTAVLLDPDGRVGKLYGAQTTPHMFIVNPGGILIYQGAIDDQASVDVNDIPKSQNYVRKALDEAMAGQPVSTAATKSYGCSVKY